MFLTDCTTKDRNGNALTFSHFLFADNTLVFVKIPKRRQRVMVCPSWILLCFEALLGFKINLEKSMIIPVGEAMGINHLAGELPSTYLGLLLGVGYNASIW